MTIDDKKSILERVNFFVFFFHLIWPLISISLSQATSAVLILWAAKADWCYNSLQSRNRKWNVHFLTKRTILTAPWKSFQKGDSSGVPASWQLLSSHHHWSCSSLIPGSSSPANASQLELNLKDTSMGTPTSPQALWFHGERQTGAPLRDSATRYVQSRALPSYGSSTITLTASRIISWRQWRRRHCVW